MKMATYDEYPIRCKTCNEQIACHADAYLGLLQSNLSKEEALNQLGIMAPCSRIAMTHPTTVFFDMENRQVIEGFIDVVDAKEETAKNESHINPVFSKCIGAGNLAPTTGLQVGQPKIIGITPVAAPVARPTTLQIVPPTKTNVLALKPVQPTAEQVGIPIKEAPLGVQMPFIEPSQVSFPTINSQHEGMKVYIGANKYTIVLDGRTFLCR